MKRAGFLLLLLLCPSTLLAEARIVHHLIRAELEPHRSRLTVTDRFRVEGLEASALRLSLNENLEITSLSSNGGELRWRDVTGGEEEEGARTIEFNMPLAGESSAEVLISYEGAILDSLRPPKEAYARSFMTTSGLIENRGAFLGGTTRWVPSIEGDLFTFQLDAVVPPSWESVSQGRMEARYEQAGRRITRWVTESPMEEVYLVAGPYLFEEIPHKNVKIQTFLYDKEDAAELRGRYIAATKQFLDRYGRDIGEYPYPKFALVENFWQTGFGMPSFTLLGEQVIRLPFIPFTSYGHEILHNWWGNGVYVDWGSGNWCEGLTAYGADYSYKEEKDHAEAVAYRRGELQKFQDYVSGNEDFPLVEFRNRSDASTQAVGYSKSTMVFHMLRNLIGDRAFREGQRLLFKERKFKVSSWEDVREAFEKASGENLSRFFEDWTTRKGAPQITLAGAEAKGGWRGGYVVEGFVRQDEPHYHLDVPIRITTEAGEESLTVYLEGREKEFKWKGDARPVALAVDPDFDLFRKVHLAEIPVSLSRTLGADSTLVIVQNEGEETILLALGDLAGQWSGPGTERSDGTMEEPALSGRSVFLLGRTGRHERFVETLPEGVQIDDTKWVLPAGEFTAVDHSLVITARHPTDPDLSWTLFLPENAEVVPVLGRKIPHYGKYGYLVFQGTENVAKGEWPSGESPLRVKLKVE